MESRRSLPVSPRRPDPATIDPRRVLIDYDRESDTFSVHLFGREHPAKVLHTSGAIDLRLDPRTHVIVGYQIEGFLTAAVLRHPQLLELAELGGIPREEIEAIRRRIDPGLRTRDAVAALDLLVSRDVALSA
jgi:hypothetical protein